MDLTSDQRELQDVVRSFFAEHVGSEYLRKRMESKVRGDAQLLATLTELGFEDGFCRDDSPFSMVELGVVAAECGRALMPEPVAERLLCEGVFPRLLPKDEAKELRDFIAGCATAVAPRECCELRCDAKGKGLSGTVSWCIGGSGASRLFAVASAGKVSRVVVLELGHASVETREVSSLDLTRSLTAVSVRKGTCLVLSEGASTLFLDLLEILQASEVYGITSRVIEFTCEYVKTREQFGVPVGGFQAVGHKLAECFASSEALGALSRFAAWSVEHSAEQRALTSRAALAQAVEVGPTVCEAAMQCHGGIGFTWEYDLHLFLRRAKTIEIGFPNSEARCAELIARAGGGDAR